MKTTTRLYDIIYSTYNKLYGDFLRDNQIIYFNPEFQFTHKIVEYDEEIKTVCRNTIFYGLDFLEGDVRERFEKEFLARFLTRTIKFQTYEVLNWRLCSFIGGIREIVTDYYTNADKYLKGNTVIEANDEATNNSATTARDNSLNASLPQDNVDMSLDKTIYDYADDTHYSKSNSVSNADANSHSTNETNSFDVGRMKELHMYHEALFNDLDKQLFSQLR